MIKELFSKLRLTRNDIHGPVEQGRPIIGSSFQIETPDGGSYARVDVSKAVMFGLGLIVNPSTKAISVGAAVASRGVALSLSRRPTSWITVADWLAMPSKVPGCRLTSLFVDRHWDACWHLWAGIDIVKKLPLRFFSDPPVTLRRGYANLAELVLGEPKTHEINFKSVKRHLEMPEGNYEVTTERHVEIDIYPRLPFARKRDFVIVSFLPGVPYPRDGRQRVSGFFHADTSKWTEALAWWRNDLISLRGGEDWRPKIPARMTDEKVDGVTVWETQDVFTGTWTKVGPVPEDKIPQSWIVEKLDWSTAIHAMAGVLGAGALALALLYSKK